MSYSVYLFAKQTRRDNEPSANPDWLEDESTLTPFSPTERATLAERLATVGFALAATDDGTQRFESDELGATALLSDRGLYLSASGMDGIFEISMFASEWAADGDTFAKLDPQDGAWEP